MSDKEIVIPLPEGYCFTDVYRVRPKRSPWLCVTPPRVTPWQWGDRVTNDRGEEAVVRGWDRNLVHLYLEHPESSWPKEEMADEWTRVDETIRPTT